jgi:hypothetical protein
MKPPTSPRLISAGILYPIFLFLLQYFYGSRKMTTLADYLMLSGACIFAGLWLFACVHYRGILAKRRVVIRIAAFVVAIVAFFGIREVFLSSLGFSRTVDWLSSPVLFFIPFIFLLGKTGQSESLPNQPPLPTPASDTPAAGAPVAPPSRAAGL